MIKFLRELFVGVIGIAICFLLGGTPARADGIFGKATVEYACTRDGAVCGRFSGNPFNWQPVSKREVEAQHERATDGCPHWVRARGQCEAYKARKMVARR